MGPTASGKTALACALADRFPLELVSVDSALVYRGLDIGAAKPDAAHPAALPARAGRYPRSVRTLFGGAIFATMRWSRCRRSPRAATVPLLVGGTGLYFRALQQGLSAMPQADAEVRERLRAEAERDRLAGIARATGRSVIRRPPPASARNDAQRLQRALEVIELTGSTPTALHADRGPGIDCLSCGS